MNLHRALIQRLETLQRAGVTHIPRVALSATPAASATPLISSAPAQDRAGMERAGLERAVQVRAAQDHAGQPSLGGGTAPDVRSASPSHRAPTVGVGVPSSGSSIPTPASASAYGHDIADPNAAASLSGMAAEVQRNLGNDAMAKRTTGGKATGARTTPSAAGPQPPAAGNKLLALGDSRPAPLPLAQRQAALQVLNAEVKRCTRCPALVANRTQTVFGVGNLQPRLCFFGEAPGADEDREGEPFVGRAGQLLNKIIEACTLKREDVYILNVLKCRPPGNRAPEEAEVDCCRQFFERQLEILRPDFICCLGASAAKALLHTAFSIGKLRGRFYDFRGAKVICTYHPAYLLRNPAAKRDVWDDMQILMKEMGIPLPTK